MAYFYYGTTFKKNESGEIFSEARFGTIAHKNKKVIMLLASINEQIINEYIG